MGAEGMVFWLCGAGALGGLLVKVISELHTAGIF